MHPALVDGEVARIDFQERTGERQQPRSGVGRRRDHGLTAAVQRPAGVRPGVEGCAGRVRSGDPDILELDTHDLGADLGQCRTDAGAELAGSSPQLDAAVAADLDGGAAVVDGTRLAGDPALPRRDGHSPASARRSLAVGIEHHLVRPADGRRADPEALLDAPGVDRTSLGTERLVCTLQVAAPDFDGVDTGSTGTQIEPVLHGVDRLGAAVATERACDRRVGEHRRDLDVGIGDGVGGEELTGDDSHHARRVAPVGAGIDQTADPDAKDAPVAVDAELEVDAARVPGLGADEVLVPREAQLHRPPGEHGRSQGVRLGGECVVLAKGTADLGADHTQLRFAEPKEPGQGGARPVRRLRRRPHGVAAVGFGHGNARRRFDLGLLLSRGRETGPDHVGGRVERGIDVADLRDVVVDDVVRGATVDGRSAGRHGRVDRGDGRQLLVVDLDEAAGVECGPIGRRHDHRHRLADVAHSAIEHAKVSDLWIERRFALEIVTRRVKGRHRREGTG